MRTLVKVGVSALLMSFVTANQALAWCLFGVIGDCGGGGGGSAAVPEFDGPGAVAAIALLVSAVAIFYQRRSK